MFHICLIPNTMIQNIPLEQTQRRLWVLHTFNEPITANSTTFCTLIQDLYANQRVKSTNNSGINLRDKKYPLHMQEPKCRCECLVNALRRQKTDSGRRHFVLIKLSWTGVIKPCFYFFIYFFCVCKACFEPKTEWGIVKCWK